MKLQLDLENKTITIEDEELNLGELTETLEKLLPGGEWKEYTLQTTTQIFDTRPVIIRDYPPSNPHPYRDPFKPYVTCNTNLNTDGMSEYLERTFDQIDEE